MDYTTSVGSSTPATWWTPAGFRREYLTHRHRRILLWLLKKGDVLLNDLVEHALGMKPKRGTRKGDNAIQTVDYAVRQLIDATLVDCKSSFIDANARFETRVKEVIGLSFTGWVLAVELEREQCP